MEPHAAHEPLDPAQLAARRDPFGDAMRALLDAVPAPLLTIGADLTVRVSNRAFVELNPAAHAGLQGRPLADLLAPVCRDGVLARFCDTGAPRGELVLDRVRLASSPETEFLATCVEFVQDGRLTGWIMRLAPESSSARAGIRLLAGSEQAVKERFAALLAVSHAVVNSLDLDTVLDTMVREVRKVVPLDECTVFLLDEAEQVLRPAACVINEYRDEVMALRLKPGEGITGTVALTGEGLIVNDALNDPRAMQVPGTPEERSALLCVPLKVRDRVVGVITLIRNGEAGFEDQELELVTLFAGQCSAAISNARLYEQTRAAYEELRETQSQLVQSAKLNALGEMAGGVAHDFNNILAAILGRTQLLLQSVTDEEVRRQLLVVEQAALDGAQAVRRVQEFTRLRQDERFETLDVNQVLLGVLELTRPAWEAETKRRGISVATAVDLRAVQPVAGNASELREVFTNLVLNAVDAMPWGGTLTLASADEDGEVVVRVRDTGVGMDPETLGRVFDPFFTTKAVKGTGLGLSVAYGIVTRHHGRIQVQSEPCQGTEFTVRFPVSSVAEAECTASALEPLPRLRALVVDDEEPVLHVMGDLLQALGQDVRVELGGAAGVEAFSREPFDVVFTDLGMPEVNGWDLALAVKSQRPGTPVVIVTGWGAQLEGGTLQARGVDFVVPKPFSLEDVSRVLRQVTERLADAA